MQGGVSLRLRGPFVDEPAAVISDDNVAGLVDQ